MTTPAGAHSHPELAQEVAAAVKAELAQTQQEDKAVTEQAAQQSADAQAAAYSARDDIAALRNEMKQGFADLRSEQEQAAAAASTSAPTEPPVALPAEPLPAPPAPAPPADGDEGQGDGGDGGDPSPPPAETKNRPAPKKRRSAYWGI